MDHDERPAGRTPICVIPAHDEAGRVGAVVEAAARHLPVLVVDDGSTDDTAREAEAAGAEVLRLTPNRGKGGALKAGFEQAVAHGAPAIVTLDADGQHDPRRIPAFLREWRREEADLVIGARDFRHMPPQRILTNTVARRLFSWAVGEYVPDNQSGYRLLSRRLIEATLSSPEQGFAFEVDVIAECVGRGWPLVWIPIETIYGDETSDIRPWAHLTSFLRVTRRARRTVGRARAAEGQASGDMEAPPQ